MRGAIRTCFLCGRTIRDSGWYGQAAYRRHTEACELKTPEQRTAANKRADKRAAKEAERLDQLKLEIAKREGI